MTRFKRFIGRVLLTLLIFSNLINPISVYAINYTDYEVKQVVYSNLQQYANVGSVSNTQSSLLSLLNSFSRLYLWVGYMHNVNPGIAKFSDAEKKNYLGILKDSLEEFNKSFDVDSENFKRLKLSVPSDNVSISDVNNSIKEISNYINSIYAEHKSFLDSKGTDSEKEEYYTTNKSVLDGCYVVLLRFQQDYSFMNAMLPYQDINTNYKLDVSPITSILENSDYSYMLDKAKESLESSINAAFSLKLSEGDTVLDKFSYVDEVDGEKTEIVNSAYLACVAASSLYMPLKDKIGGANVPEVITFLCEGETEVSELYNSVAQKKKPLYIRSYSEKKGATGSGRVAVLRDVLELVFNKKKGALVTLEGSFQSSEDGNSYEVDNGNIINRVDTGNNAGNYQNSNNQNNSNNDDNQNNSNNQNNSENNSDSQNNSNNNNSDNQNNSNNQNDSDNKGNKGYEELKDDEGNVTALESEVGESSPFSEPIFTFGDGLKGNTNTLVTYNYFKGRIDLEGELAKTGILYVNPFGDIVLSDNTVIIPAAANATYYAEEEALYNPFTEMFMEGYPKITKQEKMSLASEKDAGKMVIAIQKGEEDITGLISRIHISWANFVSGDVQAFSITKKSTIDGGGIDIMPLSSGLYNVSESIMDNIFIPEDKSFSFWNLGFDNYTTSNYKFYRMDYSTITVDGMSSPLYPPSDDSKEELIRAKYLTQSFLAMLTRNEDGDTVNDNGRLDPKLFYKILKCNLDGKTNTTGFQKIAMEDLLDENSKGFFYKLIKVVIDTCNSLIKLFGDAPGLLGIRGMMQDPLMAKFLYYSEISMVYVFIIIGLVFIANYIRRHLHLSYVIVSFIATCFFIYFGSNFIPKHLATVANFLPGNKSNQLAYKGLMLRQETNMGDTPIDADYADFGVFTLSKSSINIYRLTDYEIKMICRDYGVDPNQVFSGRAYELDSSYGLFLEGDYLKINLDKFLYTISIQGSYEGVSNRVNYILNYRKNVGSVMDYYTPYFVIMDGFVDQLNRLSTIYEIPRNQFPYKGGLRKDAFLVDAYIHSPVFLSPDDYKKSDDSMSDSLYDQLTSTSGFGANNNDFLGLNKALSTHIEDYEGSLWFSTMKDNGYFGESDENVRLYNHLIEYINYQTKKFIIDHSDMFTYISDETAIEVISLYATMVFNNEVSTWGNVLYPQNLNYSDLTVADILRPVITKDYNQFYTLGRSLIDYCYAEFGWVGAIGLAFTVVCASLISLCVNYSVYILYLLLLLFLMIRFLLAKKVSEALVGFVKVFGTMLLIYFVNITLTLFIDRFTDSGLSILFLMLSNCLCLGLCLGVLSFVITGFGTLDFGSTKVDAFFKGAKNIGNLFKNLKFGKFKTDKISTGGITDEGDVLDYDFHLDSRRSGIIDDSVIENFMRNRYRPSDNRHRQEEPRRTYRNRRPVHDNVYEDYDEEDELL